MMTAYSVIWMMIHWAVPKDTLQTTSQDERAHYPGMELSVMRKQMIYLLECLLVVAKGISQKNRVPSS
jgi:hypothetical protein